MDVESRIRVVQKLTVNSQPWSGDPPTCIIVSCLCANPFLNCACMRMQISRRSLFASGEGKHKAAPSFPFFRQIFRDPSNCYGQHHDSKRSRHTGHDSTYCRSGCECIECRCDSKPRHVRCQICGNATGNGGVILKDRKK